MTYQLVAHLDEAVQVVLEIQVRLPVLVVGLGLDTQPLFSGRCLKRNHNRVKVERIGSETPSLISRTGFWLGAESLP